MKEKEASIEITRDKSGALIGLKLFMPVWRNLKEDGTIGIQLPLLSISIDAFSDEDVEIAISEAIEGFAKSAELFGNGIEKELRVIGWISEKSSKNKNHLLSVTGDKMPFPSLIKTGQPMAFSLAM